MIYVLEHWSRERLQNLWPSCSIGICSLLVLPFSLFAYLPLSPSCSHEGLHICVCARLRALVSLFMSLRVCLYVYIYVYVSGCLSQNLSTKWDGLACLFITKSSECKLHVSAPSVTAQTYISDPRGLLCGCIGCRHWDLLHHIWLQLIHYPLFMTARE